MAAAEERQRLLDRGLVGLAEVAEPGERLLRVLALAQREGVEAAAREEDELVAEDVAERAQLAPPAVALPQQASRWSSRARRRTSGNSPRRRRSASGRRRWPTAPRGCRARRRAGPARASSASRCACHKASGTMISPVARDRRRGCRRAPAQAAARDRLRRFLSLMMIAIDTLLERFDADAPDDVDEALFLALRAAPDRPRSASRSRRESARARTTGRSPCPAAAGAPGRVSPWLPPMEIWYHSSPSLSTPRMPMWPTWWWPHEFMQPEMLRSSSPMS